MAAESKEIKQLTEAIKLLTKKLEQSGGETSYVSNVERERKLERIFEDYVEQSLKESGIEKAFKGLREGIEKRLKDVAEKAEKALFDTKRNLETQKSRLNESLAEVQEKLNDKAIEILTPKEFEELKKKKEELLAGIAEKDKQILKNYENYQQEFSQTLYNLQDQLAKNLKESFKELGEKTFKKALTSSENIDKSIKSYKEVLTKQYNKIIDESELRGKILTDDKLNEVKKEIYDSYLNQLESQTKNITLDEKTRAVLEEKLKKEKILLGRSTYEQTYGNTPIGKLVGKLTDFTANRFKKEDKTTSEFTKTTNALLGAFFRGQGKGGEFLTKEPEATTVSRDKKGIISPKEYEKGQRVVPETGIKTPEPEQNKPDVESKENEKTKKGTEKNYDDILRRYESIISFIINQKLNRRKNKEKEPDINVTPEKEKTKNTGSIIDVEEIDPNKPKTELNKNTVSPDVNSTPLEDKMGEVQETLEKATENVPLKTIISSLDPIAEKQLKTTFTEAFAEAFKAAFSSVKSSAPNIEMQDAKNKDKKEEKGFSLLDTISTAYDTFKAFKGFKKVGKFGSKVAGGAARLGSKALSAAGKALPAAGRLIKKAGPAAAKAAKLGGKALKFVPGIGYVIAAASIGSDFKEGFTDAEKTLGLKEGEKATTMDKFSSGAAGALSGLTFGAVSKETLVGNTEELRNKEQSAEEDRKKIESLRSIKDPIENRLAFQRAQKESIERDMKGKKGEELEAAKTRLEKVNQTIEKLEKQKESGITFEKGKKISYDEQGKPIVEQTKQPETNVEATQQTTATPDNKSASVEKLEKSTTFLPNVTTPTAEKSKDIKPELDMNNKLTSNSNELLYNIYSVLKDKNMGTNNVTPLVVPVGQSSEVAAAQTQSPAYDYRAKNRLAT